MVVLGGAMFPFYSLSVAYTNDWLRAEEILAASGTLVRVNGTGAVIGPLLRGGSDGGVGPAVVLLATISGLFTVVSAYILLRIVVKDPLPQERQRRWVPFPARASSVAANLIPRRRRNAKGVPVEPVVND